MNTPDIVAATEPIVEAFERLGVDYSIAGSVASSAHGIARATLDVDLVADLTLPNVGPPSWSAKTYYIYILTRRDFDRSSFARRVQAQLEDGVAARSFHIDTAEDTILHKLEWYRLGGETSERQWHDVLGVLRVQAATLD